MAPDTKAGRVSRRQAARARARTAAAGAGVGRREVVRTGADGRRLGRQVVRRQADRGRADGAVQRHALRHRARVVRLAQRQALREGQDDALRAPARRGSAPAAARRSWHGGASARVWTCRLNSDPTSGTRHRANPTQLANKEDARNTCAPPHITINRDVSLHAHARTLPVTACEAAGPQLSGVHARHGHKKQPYSATGGCIQRGCTRHPARGPLLRLRSASAPGAIRIRRCLARRRRPRLRPAESAGKQASCSVILVLIRRAWNVLLLMPIVSALSPSPRFTVLTASQRQNMMPCRAAKRAAQARAAPGRRSACAPPPSLHGRMRAGLRAPHAVPHAATWPHTKSTNRCPAACQQWCACSHRQNPSTDPTMRSVIGATR